MGISNNNNNNNLRNFSKNGQNNKLETLSVPNLLETNSNRLSPTRYINSGTDLDRVDDNNNNDIHKKQQQQQTTVCSPPDGGFGWAVVFASFMCNVIVDGIIFSFGILLPEISHEFNENKATTAWIGSLQTGFYLIVGPLVSFLVTWFDSRTITFVGTFLAAFGFVISYFAPNVITLYFTFGILGGIGFGFVFLPAIVTVGHYFEKKRAFATGIAVCGSGIGNFIFPPIIQFLIEQSGWRTTILILAGITLFCAVFGSLFRPLKYESNPDDAEQNDSNVPLPKPLLMRIKEARAADWARSEEDINEESPTGSQNSAPPPYMEAVNRTMVINIPTVTDGKTIQISEPPPPSSPSPMTPPMTPNNDINRKRSKSILSNMGESKHQLSRKTYSSRDEMLYSNLSLVVLPHSRSYGNLSKNRTQSVLTDDEPEPQTSCLSGFSLSLLKRPSFVLLALSGFICLVGFFIPFIYLSDRAKLLGISPDRCAFIVSIIGIANTIGRVLCGWASDNRVNALLLNNVALTVGGIATIISPMVFNSYYSLIFYGSVFGLSVASFATLRSVITVELLGLEQLNMAFGLLLLFQGLAVTIGSPIAGWFFDITGSYDYSFYLAGSAIAFSGIMCYPLNVIARWEKKFFNDNDSYQDDEDDYDVDDDGNQIDREEHQTNNNNNNISGSSRV